MIALIIALTAASISFPTGTIHSSDPKNPYLKPSVAWRVGGSSNVYLEKERRIVNPRINGPKLPQSQHGRFCQSFLLLSKLAITDFGNKEKLCLVPSNPRGLTVTDNVKYLYE